MFEVGDWVVVTIKRDDYFGLEGVVVAPGVYPHTFPYTRLGLIPYIPVALDSTIDLPLPLAQMPQPSWREPYIYFFTESQIELIGSWNCHAEQVLGEDYFK